MTEPNHIVAAIRISSIIGRHKREILLISFLLWSSTATTTVWISNLSDTSGENYVVAKESQIKVVCLATLGMWGVTSIVSIQVGSKRINGFETTMTLFVQYYCFVLCLKL